MPKIQNKYSNTVQQVKFNYQVWKCTVFLLFEKYVHPQYSKFKLQITKLKYKKALNYQVKLNLKLGRIKYHPDEYTQKMSQDKKIWVSSSSWCPVSGFLPDPVNLGGAVGGRVVILITLATRIQDFIHYSIEIVLWFVTLAQGVGAVRPHEQKVRVGHCVIPKEEWWGLSLWYKKVWKVLSI